jgi:GNAT acetyltransferase-like protein
MSDLLSPGTLQWFDLADLRDRAAYHKVWLESTVKRPHDHPHFLEMMKPAFCSPMAAVYQHSPVSRIVYPFNSCCLNELPAFSDIRERLMHLVSPYGYGGPLYEGVPSEYEKASLVFEELLNSELIRRGYVSEFVREDIFRERLAARFSGQLIEQQPNVVVRLGRSDEEIWRTYKAKVRKNVNRAREFNLRVEFDPAGLYLEDFLRVYHETMQRTNASEAFIIHEDRFLSLTQTLGRDGGVMYVHVFDDDAIVSTELLLLSQDTIYSFLGGTLDTAYAKRPNDLLKHEVICWGKNNGFKWYVLGGGVTPSDGIYCYKEAFDPYSIFPFYVRRNVINGDAYQMLIGKRLCYENVMGNNWVARPDFFPEYLS